MHADPTDSDINKVGSAYLFEICQNGLVHVLKYAKYGLMHILHNMDFCILLHVITYYCILFLHIQVLHSESIFFFTYNCICFCIFYIFLPTYCTYIHI